MNITVYTISFDEEVLMQFMIDHYRFRFPNCNIVVYDNQSTDKTVEICKSNNCEVRYYNSGGKIDDQRKWDTKNNCWRDAKTDWVLVCDVDELLDITLEQLDEESANGTTKIKCESWQMVNMEDNFDVKNIKYGYRDATDHECYIYDKDLLFNKKYVDINYNHAGCHYTDSKGIIKNSKPYKMYHYRYINRDAFCAKMKRDASRRNDNDIKNSWGIHCTFGDEFFRKRYDTAKNGAIKIFP
jgi:glycosyltransferase involved in cell wall biosynthesis